MLLCCAVLCCGADTMCHSVACHVLCSDYEYTSQMMSFAYDRHLPAGMAWRDLFDMVREGLRSMLGQRGVGM